MVALSIASSICAENVQWACDETVNELHELWKKYCKYDESQDKYEIYRPREYIVKEAIDIVKKHFDGWSE